MLLKSVEGNMAELLLKMWSDDQGQDVAEYALMLSLILVVVAAIVKTIGTTANSIFQETVNKLSGK